MDRQLQPELLDHLPPDDPLARQSRKDLLRLNTWMGHAGIMSGALSAAFASETPRRIVELGAGDGKFMLRMAQRFCSRWKTVEVILVDQEEVATEATRGDFAALGWKLHIIKADAIDWLGQCGSEVFDGLVANLFLHHFSDEQLEKFFREAGKRTNIFIALEPRRSEMALVFSRLVWFIGSNKITRHDAPISVRAGFREKELTRLWPDDPAWLLQEREAGLFSHLFVAQRETAACPPSFSRI